MHTLNHSFMCDRTTNLGKTNGRILALFREQFATQFTSQSLTWLDHLIFAMVPLGIITIVSGAIRVAGPPIAKALIGRARENRALAEVELMSSTSYEVCEMFNGNSIIRAIGRPKIAHFLLFPDSYKKPEPGDCLQLDNTANFTRDNFEHTCGIHTIKTAYEEKLITCERKSRPISPPLTIL